MNPASRSPPGPSGARPPWPLPLRLYAAAVRRLQTWFGLRLFFIYRRTLTPGLEIPEELQKDYSFREISAEVLLRFADDPVLGLSAERIHAATQRGDVFFGVFLGAELVAYRWYSLSGAAPCEDDMLLLYEHPERAYGYRTFTHPAHRGRRLHLYSTRDSDSRLADRGYTHTVGYIAVHNIPSLKANSRLPSVDRIGIIASLKVLGRLLVFRSPGAARNHVNLAAQP